MNRRWKTSKEKRDLKTEKRTFNAFRYAFKKATRKLNGHGRFGETIVCRRNAEQKDKRGKRTSRLCRSRHQSLTRKNESLKPGARPRKRVKAYRRKAVARGCPRKQMRWR